MGVEQPPDKAFKKSLSIFVHKAVLPLLKFLQAFNENRSCCLHTTIIAPCAGAGNIQSSSFEFSGRRSILSSPAAAKMTPCQLLSFSVRKRLLTLPLRLSSL